MLTCFQIQNVYFLSVSSKFVENSQSTSENGYFAPENWPDISHLQADINEQLSDSNFSSILPFNRYVLIKYLLYEVTTT